MIDRTQVIESLRKRLPGDGKPFSLCEAIDAFEASYRTDRFSDDGDSLTLVGWQGEEGQGAYFQLALGRSISGDLFEFPTIVTASLRIPIAPSEIFASELDERFGDAFPATGQLHLVCDDLAAADAFFARVRNLPLVRKYGTDLPTSCESKLCGDEEMREITGKLLDYFAVHGCPTVEDK